MTDAAVKNAVLAISTLFEHPLLNAYHPPPVGIVYTDKQRIGLNWYAKAVSSVFTRISIDDELKQIETALLTCLLFTSVEVQQVNIGSTVALLEKGLRLVARYKEVQEGSPSKPAIWVLDLVIPALCRQTIVFGIFGYALSQEAFTILDALVPTGPTTILSLDDVRNDLYAILVRIFNWIQRVTAARPGSEAVRLFLQRERDHMLDWLRSWAERTQSFMETIDNGQHHGAAEVYSVLCCYERVAYLWLSRSLHGHMYNDAEEQHSYMSILSYSEEALKHGSSQSSPSGASVTPFMLELGVMPALVFVGWQCRDIGICRQAVKLMRRCPAQENLLVTELQVDLIQRLIAVEEMRSAETLLHVHGQQEGELVQVPIVDRSLGLPRPGPPILEDEGWRYGTDLFARNSSHRCARHNK
ncbi:uncharacterized protein AB675_12172 [Cyphellophora attinorum]|uniref:Transcription factor domain-containing protein n=1 Tax=Cyphellophora attinorum TaxID=1664694 RepID=A0A0N1NXY8_9EURO|nr:uncharacterized protein AB675_12172 [Phialophora attinorum]KPI38436.1 hypothetical protein AB675_12172 [Phialophora attinorum]